MRIAFSVLAVLLRVLYILPLASIVFLTYLVSENSKNIYYQCQVKVITIRLDFLTFLISVFADICH